MSTKPRSRSRKAPLAPVITVLNDFNAVVGGIAELRATLGEATAAPNATRRVWAFQRLWRDHATTQARLGTITAPGLRTRRAELQRQLDAVHYEATVAAVRETQRARGGDVVSLAEARARRAAGA
ncbi:hypothetical protein [Sorangium sp. So ce233]|uniref:hypothetical protein n=1 Tax=Sorangium sp. So ce233 TaxID=3133290 RepID=UPI003F5EA89A